MDNHPTFYNFFFDLKKKTYFKLSKGFEIFLLYFWRNVVPKYDSYFSFIFIYFSFRLSKKER